MIVMEAAHDRPVCPECRAGKHPNCNGAAWDFNTDEPAICACWVAGHE